MAHSHVGPSRGVDAVSVLTFYVCAMLAIPAPLVVGALGTAGAPSTLLAIAAFMWWAWYHLQRDYPIEAGFQPVRATMLAFLFVVLVAYAHAMIGPMVTAELTPADSGVLRTVGLAGVLLVANDGISTLDRHRTIIRRLVLGVGLVAVLGLVQYATRQPIVDRISIPGLVPGTADWTLAQRSGLSRPSGTSTHPIEFGFVLSMVLPLAVVFALKSPTRRWLYRALLGAVSFAVFLSISRSAIICASVAMCVLASSWSAAARIKAAAVLLTLMVLVYLTVPGVLGTVTKLFTGISEDASIQSRTGSYDVAAQFIGRSPIIGRGVGIFLPDYWILDNAYLVLLIDAGIVGLASLLALIATAIYSSRRATVLARDEFDREIARALLAAVAAGAAGFAFFDAFAYPQSSGVSLLLMGLCGAAWRLQRAEARSRMPAYVPSGASRLDERPVR